MGLMLVTIFQCLSDYGRLVFYELIIFFFRFKSKGSYFGLDYSGPLTERV